MDLGFWDGRGSFEEIKVAAFMRLLDVLHKEFSIPTRVDFVPGAPCISPESEIRLTDTHVQLAPRHINFDHIAIA
jgi:hypothetical protein